MIRFTQLLVFLILSTAVSSTAQEAMSSDASARNDRSNIATLEFSQPKTVEDLNPSPLIVGRFDCDDEGDIYTFIDGYSLNGGGTPNQRLALLAIHPDGTVTHFPYQSSPGFVNFSMPKSLFVGKERISMLVSAEIDLPKADPRRRVPLVLTFDKKGVLISTTTLPEDLAPLVLGVFPSGDFVLLSEDRLNHRMALSVISKDGVVGRELRLNDSDFITKASEESVTPGVTGGLSPLLLISMSKFFPLGDHLLLVPFETSGLPMVELDEHGVIRSTVPRLPKGTVIDGYISSSISSWKLRLGTVIESNTQTLDGQGKALGIATRPTPEIVEFSRIDGSLLRKIDIGSDGMQPACEAGGAFRFLTASNSGARMQVVTAQVH